MNYIVMECQYGLLHYLSSYCSQLSGFFESFTHCHLDFFSGLRFHMNRDVPDSSNKHGPNAIFHAEIENRQECLGLEFEPCRNKWGDSNESGRNHITKLTWVIVQVSVHFQHVEWRSNEIHPLQQVAISSHPRTMELSTVHHCYRIVQGMSHLTPPISDLRMS